MQTLYGLRRDFLFGPLALDNRIVVVVRRVSTPGQTQTGLGRGFILLLPQTAVLPGSDAGSDVIKPASSFVIQKRQTLIND